MSAIKLSFEESLQERVVAKELCSGCSACVLVCPFACLDYFEEKPRLIKQCEVCGICARICPRLELPQSALEKLVFERERRLEDQFGIYRRFAIAQATNENILKSCQDGGVVSALLTSAFESGIIDSAVVSDISMDKPWFPMPRLISTSQEVLHCSGTRYTYSPNLSALREAVQQKRKSIGFVGTPCHIQSLRRMEAFPLKKYSDIIKFTIGLMCTESFTYDEMMKKYIAGTLGVNLNDVKKINIKGKVIITMNSGEIKTIPLQEAKQFTRKGCLPCTDFSAELADISTGGLGLTGWTFTIIRTKKGEDIFDRAEKAGAIRTRPVEEEKFALDLLVKLSRKKRKTT